MATRFGIAIPQSYPDAPVDPAALAEHLRAAEALGYHSAWVGEEILKAPMLDPIGLLEFAAAHTERMLLGTAVLVTTLRSPLHLAKALVTLDHLSQGRLIVGVGLGQSTRSYPAFGVPTEHRVRRYLEGIAVMRKLWTEESLTFQGEYWKFQGERMEPKPIQKPHPPIWFSGRHVNALGRAARLADGWIGGKIVLDEFRGHVVTLRRLLAEAKRDSDSFGIAKRVIFAVDSDRARIEKRLMAWFGAAYGNPEEAKTAAIYGGEAECADKIGQIVAAGAKTLIMDPVLDPREQMEALAKGVLPALR